jgi:PIN domain nuclease of toxin-antitoxin system
VGPWLRLLLDTCTFVWLASESARLSKRARKALDAVDSELVLSDASVLEICLKWTAGKITLPSPPRVWVEEQAGLWHLKRAPLAAAHYYRTTELPGVHRDPFDRLLVAHAIEAGLTLVSPDRQLREYPIATLW